MAQCRAHHLRSRTRPTEDEDENEDEGPRVYIRFKLEKARGS
jgi:hypothetical protein